MMRYSTRIVVKSERKVLVLSGPTLMLEDKDGNQVRIATNQDEKYVRFLEALHYLDQVIDEEIL